MKLKNRWRIAALCLACSVIISTPVMADSDNIISRGLSNLQQERVLTAKSDQAVKQEVDAALDRALSYLKTTVTSPIVDSVGGEWSVMAMARNNSLSEQTKLNYITNLLNTLDSKQGVLHTMKYTEYSRVAMALTSIGADPENIGGYNILQPLSQFEKVCIQGINGPIFALIAFDTKNYEIPEMKEGQSGQQTTRESLIQYILEHQLPGGGWSLVDVPDDMTPMAVQALAPYYSRPEVKAAVDKALDVWSRFQEPDGGFNSAGGSETISQTIIALSALNPNLLQSEKFIKNGNTMLDALLSYQMSDGSFRHVKGGISDLMSSDQATLALTAYDRALSGKTRLYDMTDVKENNGEADSVVIEIMKTELKNLTEHLSLDDKDRVYSLQAQLEQMGEFEGKEEAARQLETLKKELDRQQKEVSDWDHDMWTKIDPENITLKEQSVIEELRVRYDAMPKENRNYLEQAEDLFMAEEKIINLKNGDQVLVGLKQEPSSQQQTYSVTDHVQRGTTTRNRNTGMGQTQTKSRQKIQPVKEGSVSASFFEQIQGKDENLKMEWKFEDGTKYVMTINGEDVKQVRDMNIQLIKGSLFEEDIKKLAEDPFMFYFADQGEFPGQMQVEMEVDLDDGQYLLLKYNEEERRAQYIQKIEVKDGQTRFILSESGDYFISKKAHSKSLNEIEKGDQVKKEDILFTGTKEESKKMSPMIGLAAAAVVFIAAVLLWFKRRKGLK